jgi:hypothetical protein
VKSMNVRQINKKSDINERQERHVYPLFHQRPRFVFSVDRIFLCCYYNKRSHRFTQGRVRSFPHEKNNWASFLYIDVSDLDLDDVRNFLVKVGSSSSRNVKITKN